MSDRPIPTILDTDIGGDIDDTWALAFLLASPEVDLRMVLAATGNTVYRARIAAKLLDLAGRNDVVVGVGVKQNDEEQGQAAWVEGYDIGDYGGVVRQDGVQALVQALLSAEEPMTLVCIGPLTNIAAALRVAPEIAPRTRFVGMHGSLKRGVLGAEGAIAEWNVICDVPAAQAVFSAPWQSVTITPLDTCGQVQLRGDLYAQIRDSDAILPRLVIENYLAWAKSNQWHNPDTESSILFDTVAAYLVYCDAALQMERLDLRITDDGFMVPDPAGSPADCAVEWADQDGFQELLVRRLIAGPVGATLG